MRNSHKLGKVLSIITVLSILGGIVTPLLTGSPVYAADVSSYIDLTQDADDSGDGVTPSTVDTPPALGQGATEEFYISYESSGELTDADNITVNIPGEFTNVQVCQTSDVTDADDDGSVDGSMSVSGNTTIGWTATYDLSAATTTATNGVEVCFQADTPTTRGNYSVYISDGTDTSPALIYVSDGSSRYDNDVEITAQVPTNLALRVMDPTSEVVTDTCDLGVLNPTAVNSCSYRVAAGTNHTGGLYVEVVADSTLDNATDDIDDVDNGGGDISIDAGTEEHGFEVTTEGSALTASGSYAGQANVVPSTETQILSVSGSTVDDAVTANWSTVQHSASVDTATPSGAYDQLVTYRAFANT